MAGAGALAFRRRAWAFAQSSSNLRKFVISLPGLGPAAQNEIGQYIPLATKNTVNFAGQLTDTYNLAVATYSERMHPDLPGKSDFLGYFDLATYDQKYLGGAIVATKGRPVLLRVTNKTPIPSSRRRRPMRFSTVAASETSSALVGSSHKSNSGGTTVARASATRWR